MKTDQLPSGSYGVLLYLRQEEHKAEEFLFHYPQQGYRFKTLPKGLLIKKDPAVWFSEEMMAAKTGINTQEVPFFYIQKTSLTAVVFVIYVDTNLATQMSLAKSTYWRSQAKIDSASGDYPPDEHTILVGYHNWKSCQEMRVA